MSLVMSLNFTTTSMMVLVAGLLGAAVAPDPSLATLPIAIMVVGAATAAIPAAMIMQRLGRKTGIALGIFLALIGVGLAYLAAMMASFWLFLAGTLLIGFNAAFTQQGRFIILENAQGEQQQADGLTLALLANLFAAVIGPQIGAYGKDMIVSPAGYAGSFVLAAVVLLISLLTLCGFKNLPMQFEKLHVSHRTIVEIAKQPIFIMAAGSAAIGFWVMSLVMTATPISMHEINGHSLEHTTLVIQTHIVAMFLPSLLTGMLLKKGLRTSLLLSGLILYAVVSLIGFSGAQVVHYWWALLLLGLGWNLLFLTSTALLPQAYERAERFKAQALNDFLLFSTQAIAAFAAGWFLFNLGWNSILWIALCCTGGWALLIITLHRKIAEKNTIQRPQLNGNKAD